MTYRPLTDQGPRIKIDAATEKHTGASRYCMPARSAPIANGWQDRDALLHGSPPIAANPLTPLARTKEVEMDDDMPLPDRMIREEMRRERLAPKGIKVTEADIGRAVVYRTAPNYEPEQGIITSFNEKNVFVRYGSSVRGVATNPDDLDWAVRS